MKRCSELKDLLRAGSGVRFRKFQNILIEIGKPDVAELLGTCTYNFDSEDNSIDIHV